MKELWDKAREYGLTRLYTHEDGNVSCTIVFRTSTHIKLEACSGYSKDITCPEQALRLAIDQAKVVAGDLAKEADKFKRLADG